MDAAIDPRVAAWAASGAMALTGREGEAPLGPPERLVGLVTDAAARLRRATGGAVDVDGLALLAERAALEGLARHGTTSCGGSARLLPALDGWVALSLPRPDDLDLLPAWLGVDPGAVDPADPWPAVAGLVAGRSAVALDAQAALLGLPAAALGVVAEVAELADAAAEVRGAHHPLAGVRAEPVGPAAAPSDGAPGLDGLDGLTVVDLTSLWAGPLCTSLLLSGGASVTKVESTGRPDGARLGDPAFYELLNGGKREVRVDLATAAGRAALGELVAGADVVVEASRPRALEQLGIVAADVLARPHGPRLWVSITGFGRAATPAGSAGRVAFGDVAAVAGGLVARDDRGPVFCADAVADPLAGLLAAAAVAEHAAGGGRWLLDVSMAGASAAAGGPTLSATGVAAAPPRARRPR